MKNKFIILISSLVFAIFSSTSAKSESITLGWAAWDPANALVELSKDFTAETGIDINFEFVPWTSFADRMLNELNNQGKPIEQLIAKNLGVDISNRIQQLKVEEPPKRKGGIKVANVAELVSKLKNEAKVI